MLLIADVYWDTELRDVGMFVLMVGLWLRHSFLCDFIQKMVAFWIINQTLCDDFSVHLILLVIWRIKINNSTFLSKYFLIAHTCFRRRHKCSVGFMLVEFGGSGIKETSFACSLNHFRSVGAL